MEHSLEKERIPRNEDSIPSLFSFITFRRESVGGFLFNPYLFNEIPLSNIEIRILEHCNGNFSLRDITGRIRDELSLSHDQAYQCIHEAMNVFEGYCAINWVHQRHDSAHQWGGTACSMHPPAGCQAKSNSSNNSSNNSILSAPLSVLWEITRKCNLGCKHCLIDAGVQDKDEMSLNEVKRTIEHLAELKVFKITFGGGEPLARKDFMDILDYATGFDLGIKLSTNGMLVNDQLIDRLGDTNVCSVQVSVDGLESTHNAFRGSERSFKKATSALKSFSDAGYWTMMSTAVTRYNIDELEELLDLAIDCGVSAFKASPFIPVGKGKENIEELAISQQEIRALAGIMLEKKQEYEGVLDLQIDGLFPWLLGPCDGTHGYATPVGCSAGVSEVVFTPTGDVLACPFLQDFVAGNLRDRSLKDIWEDSEIFNVFRNLTGDRLEGECNGCGYVPDHCQGGCRAAAFAWTGNLFAHDPHCWKGLE